VAIRRLVERGLKYRGSEMSVRKIIISGALVALTVSAAGTAENYNSAISKLADCKTGLRAGPERYTFSAGYCAGTVRGIAYMLNSPVFCPGIPEGVTNYRSSRSSFATSRRDRKRCTGSSRGSSSRRCRGLGPARNEREGLMSVRKRTWKTSKGEAKEVH